MANDFYNHDDGYPAFNAAGASSQMRSELDKLALGFDKMPGLTGNGGRLIRVNILGTALEAFTSFTDDTDYNTSTSAHGLAPKLNGDAMSFLNGVGAWASISGNTLRRSARTSNTILAGADNAYLIDITSGSFTQTITAVATLGSGWYCVVRNSGTGDIVLDPNGAELIEGLASLPLPPGGSFLIQCDGTALYAVAVSPSNKVFTTSGTYIAPETGWYVVEAIGASGGSGSGRRGAAGTSRFGGGGSGGGARTMPTLVYLTAGQSVTVTVGAGGTAGAAVTADNTNGNPGGVGGTSSFGTFCVAYGGGGGLGGDNGAGGTGGGGGGGSSAGASGGDGGAPNANSFGTGSTKSNIGQGGAGGGGFSAEYGGGSGYTSVSGVPAAGGGGSLNGGAGGGAGGSISAADTASAGSNGGKSGSYANGFTVPGGLGGAAGIAGTANPANTSGAGDGAGGGGAYNGVTVGAGTVGSAPGGGSGGGGGSTNGTNSGAGAVGARGEVRVRKI